MVLPSRDVVKDIRNLINEITGFEENEENFYLCEQYCLSHVMHHTYPSVNKNEVKNLIDGYVHRFFVHGYFKVADGLDAEVKKFLDSDLFKKNPEFDIQWALLGLVTGLASNLTAVSKLPNMMPIADDDKPSEEINWGEYLKEGLPNYEYQHSEEDSDSDSVSFYSQSSDIFGDDEGVEPEETTRKKMAKNETSITKDENSLKSFYSSRQHIIDELVKRREEEISYTRDIISRGNLIEELGFFVNTGIPEGTPQMLSEFEMVGYVLKQFLTGENIFKRKGITNPCTCSLTEHTIRSYLDSLQPYVNMIKVFKEFSQEVSNLELGSLEKPMKPKLSEGSSYAYLNSGLRHTKTDGKCTNVNSNVNKMNPAQRSVPNVVKLYNLALSEALNSFENKILSMSEYQNSYTLLQVLNELRPSFNDLSSLFAVHLVATANWLNEPNWLCSVRIIMSLYKAVLHSTSNRMGFLYMNMLLCCFQAYLDITDSWISCLSLNDPHDEYIIYKSDEPNDSDASDHSYRVHPYKDELQRIGIKEIKILDYLANKMIHVGHSIDVLRRLDRSLIKDENYLNSGALHESLYKTLLRNMKDELKELEDVLLNPGNEITEFTLDEDATSNTIVPVCENSDGSKELSIAGDSNNNTKTLDIYSYKGTGDLLRKDFITSESVIVAKDIALSSYCMKMCQNDRNDIIEKSIWPLVFLIEANVKKIINARVLNTCDVAKDVVVNEFQLKTHLRLLRSILLFNDPHVILPFMFALFDQELLWQNSYVLTVLLRKGIESRYAEQVQYLRVSVEENFKKPPKNVLEALDRITISYEVEWPLQLIFTPRIMALYNNVFRHLFKLHWAHETLCKLRFTMDDSKESEIVKSSRRRLELLRFLCLGSVARLRSYFMAQISTPFDLQLNSYQHLKHIIKAHEAFIQKIHSRCLLDEEAADGRGLIFNMLIPVCYDISQFWSSGDAIPENKLATTENLFFKSQQQFPRLMAVLEKE